MTEISTVFTENSFFLELKKKKSLGPVILLFPCPDIFKYLYL